MYFYYEKCRNEGVYAVLSVMSPISRGNLVAVWPPYHVRNNLKMPCCPYYF